MALSGSFGVGTSGNVTGLLEWSGTQSISGNYTDISFTLKFKRTTAYRSWDDNQAYFYVWVNGQITRLDNVGYDLPASMAWVTIMTGSVRVPHEANGSKRVRIEVDGSTAQFDIYYTDTYHDLNTIPRASTLTSGISFTAGIDSLPISIARASTDFHHSVEVFVEYQDTNTYGGNITKKDWVYDSTTITFTPAEIEEMYRHIGQYERVDVIVRVWTYDSGGTQIGSYQDKMGSVYAVATSYPTVDGDNRWAIASSIPFFINNFHSGFNYDLTFAFGSFTKTISNVTTQNYTMTFTTGAGSELETIYAQIPNENEGTGIVTVRKKYGTTLVEDGVGASNGNNALFTAVVTNSNPVFSESQVVYEDSNTTTAGITGNNQYIIQNKSDLKITVNTPATAQNGSSISRYDVTVNGVTQTSTTTGWYNFGNINASSNITFLIKVYDSRGNSTQISKAVNILPYQNPVIVASATRLNGFEDTTTLAVNGSASKLDISGANKNSIVSVKYQYRQVGGSYNTATSMTVGGTFPNYSVTSVNLNGATGLDKLKSWEVLVTVADKISTVTVTKVVPVGQPIMFMDATKKSVGINQFPTNSNSFEITGGLYHNGGLVLDERKYSFPATSGWFRIGQSAVSIGNNSSAFEIHSSLSGQHQTTKIEAGMTYGRTASVMLNQLSHTQWSSATFTKMRIVYHTTYTNNYAYLEIYKSPATATTVTIRQFSGRGWGLYQDPVASDTLPTGYVSEEITFASGIVTNGTILYDGGNRKPVDMQSSGSAIDITGFDLNSDFATGFYMGYSNPNAPATNKWFYIEVIRHNASWCVQKATYFEDPNSNWIRIKNNGNWSYWFTQHGSEGYGNNANGYYMRLNNGLQICWQNWFYPAGTTHSNASINHPYGGYYMYRSSTWTFPIAFGIAPSVTLTGDWGGVFTEQHLAYNGSGSTTSCGTESGAWWSGGWDTTTKPSLTQHAIAIGRWW